MSTTLDRQHAARRRRYHLEAHVMHETHHLVPGTVATWLLRDVLRFALDIPGFGPAPQLSNAAIVALTTLRAWQYRIWVLLDRPSGPHLDDRVTVPPLPPRTPRPRQHKPDGSAYKQRPPVTKDPLDWATGRDYAVAIAPHLQAMVQPIEWNAYELRLTLGANYVRIGRQLAISAKSAKLHSDRVRNLHEQWLSIPKFCTRLTKMHDIGGV